MATQTHKKKSAEEKYLLDVRLKVTGKKAKVLRAFLEKKMESENRDTYPNAIVATLMERVKSDCPDQEK